MSTFLENQNWRYATKKYDSAKKISAQDLDTLKEAIRISASSYGLQPYTVFIIENAELREKLKEAAYGQTQITDASQVVVFANNVDFTEKDVDGFISNISKTREVPVESLTGYGDYMKSTVMALTADVRNIWTAKQTYIALANLLAAGAELKIDVTPMEGFNAASFNEILGLTEKGLNAAVIATMGYRHEEDALQYLKKVRKPNSELFVTL